MTQSHADRGKWTSGVDHDYSRIMMSSRLLPSLLCNDVQSGILDMAYAVHIFIVCTISLVVYTLYTDNTVIQLKTANSSLIFL